MEKYQNKPMREPEKPVKKSNWRQKHQAFLNMVQSAKTGDIPSVVVDPNPDYVSCPHCNRRFNENAAERHIPYCKDTKQKTNQSPRKQNDEALKKRISYKPPTPKKAKK
jgi:hypothetical protein